MVHKKEIIIKLKQIQQNLDEVETRQCVQEKKIQIQIETMKIDKTAERMRSDSNLKRTYELWDQLEPERQKELVILDTYIKSANI